jgi:predicted phosphodiesterase
MPAALRVAALYDFHANVPALEAVLAEVERVSVDRIVIGGDVCRVRCRSRRSSDYGRSATGPCFVRGNGDRWVVDKFDTPRSLSEGDERPGRPWAASTADAIDRRDRDLPASFAERAVLAVDGLGPTLFCHSSPRDDEELPTTLTPERRWRPALEGVAESVVVCGHAHAHFDRQLGPWRLVNAGAVGLPYEGRAGAYWLLLGPDVEHRRTDYDFDRAIALLRAGGNPAPTSCSSLSPSLGFFQQVGWRQRRGRLLAAPVSQARAVARAPARAEAMSTPRRLGRRCSASPRSRLRPTRPQRVGDLLGLPDRSSRFSSALTASRSAASARSRSSRGQSASVTGLLLCLLHGSTSSGGSGNPPCSRARTAGGRRRAGPHAGGDRRRARPPGRRS